MNGVVRYRVPNPWTIKNELGVPYRVAHNVWRVLRTAAHGNIGIREALERAREILAQHDHTWEDDAEVRDFRISPSGGQWSGDEESLGIYIDRHDDAIATLAWLDGDYLRRNYVYDKRTKKTRLEPRDHGFYVMSYDEERTAWEEDKLNTKTEDDYENEGPQDSDLWTEDANAFYVYRSGRAHGLGSDKFAGRIAMFNLPQRTADVLTVLNDRLQEIKDAANEADDDGDHQKAAALKAEWTRLREAYTRVGRRYASMDTEWDGSPEAYEECERPAVWWGIQRIQNQIGYFGNVWFKESGRDGQWRMLKPPKNYLFWQRAQAWRKAYRTRAEAVKAQVKAVGATPQPGDVYTDHLYAGYPMITFYRVGTHAPLFTVTRREIQAGTAWSTIWRNVGSARLWSAQPHTDPLSWALVSPSNQGVLRGLGGLSRRVRRQR